VKRRERWDPQTAQYKCANPACPRWLGVKDYLESHPGPEVPAEEIHNVVDTSVPPITLLCSCGHYTVVWNQKP
jgi:hypothetical protein